MVPLKQREERKTVFVRARLRTDRGWSDVTIGNVSSRGLLLQGVAPLRRNDFIEVRYGHICIVGRIVWTGGSRCGVRTQEKVDVAGLLAPPATRRRKRGEDRRAVARKVEAPRRRPAAADKAEASRRTARLFDWAIIAIGGGAAAAFVAQFAYSTLDTPLASVGAALAGNG